MRRVALKVPRIRCDRGLQVLTNTECAMLIHCLDFQVEIFKRLPITFEEKHCKSILFDTHRVLHVVTDLSNRSVMKHVCSQRINGLFVSESLFQQSEDEGLRNKRTETPEAHCVHFQIKYVRRANIYYTSPGGDFHLVQFECAFCSERKVDENKSKHLSHIIIHQLNCVHVYHSTAYCS